MLIPELSVSNFEKSLKFYVTILGFSILYQRKEEGFVYLTLNQAHIMIDAIGIGRTWKTGEFSYPLGRGVNFQIQVACIEPLLCNLKVHNIALFQDVEEKWYKKDNDLIGHKQFLVMDPDGYLLRFFEEIQNSGC